MSTLIVVLPLESPGAATPLEYLLMPDGRTPAAHDRAAAALLPSASEVVALVPAQALSWHRVELPRGTLGRGALGGAPGAPRLRAVLEGLLEDKLLDEPGDVHFALQPGAQAQTAIWVASCRRDWLRGALALLETAGRRVLRVVPELAPAEAERLHVIGSADQPQLAYSGPDGACVLPFGAASVAWATARAETPDSLDITAEPALAAFAEQALGRPIPLQQGTDRWLQAAATPWDLAQFDLANSDRSRAWKHAAGQARALWHAPQWRAARWGAAAVVATHLVGLNAWAWKESGALAAKRAAVNTTLTSTFPGVKVVIDAPVQMEREIALLRQSAGAYSPRDFEAMLSAVGSAAPPEQTVQAVEFSAGELRLKGIELNAAASADLNKKLQAAGLRAQADGDRWLVRPYTGPGAAP